ncbi:WD repeat-containing protein 75 [Trametes pubescens]|uniref:WD repeat-containing protein 75 n=1 Tax=Trametes pubescens TaxID=154538 RepID=A0A1M2V5B8_TRAPU|nr:WD repeat-containing protein 75 [Trametes pubescens]
MPVAVDRTRTMTAPDTHDTPAKVAQDIPLAGATQTGAVNPRKKRKAKGKEVEDAEEAWSWKSLTDSSASRVPPIFTKDGSYFFSAAGPSVKIHSVATGEVVSTLTPPLTSVSGATGSSAQSDVVTAAILNPHNPFQLITGSLDGYVRVWDFLDASLLQTINIAQPIFHLTAHERFREHVFVAAARPTKKKTSKAHVATAEDNVAVLRVAFKPTAATAGAQVQTSSEVVGVGKTRSTTGLAISPSGAWLVATAGHKAYVCQTADLKGGFTKFVSPERLTCLAFHPSEEYFATGDATGCIRLWYCLNESIAIKTSGVEKTAQTTTLHWHAHAVSSLTFTPNGAYLLSGGEESVLVIWQLHTGKKEFVPRVGSPIVHVALTNNGGEEEYLLGLADASFVFVRASTLKIARSIARIKLDPAISHDRPSTSTAPLAIHSLSSTLILPSSHPSSLQTFSPSTSTLLSELEVSPSNRVSRRDDKPLQPSRVEHVVLSDSGDWMATIDSREADEMFRGEEYMKIWQWDRKSGFWILNTRIDRPHGLKKATGVAFRPGARTQDDLLLATTGEDGNIKTWRIRSVQTKSEGVEEFWVARSTLRFRDEIPSDVSWSPDGSLLAVSVGSHVAVYDPDTNALCQVVTCPECTTVSSARFVGSSGRYMVISGPRDVLLWDLVSQSLRWHYRSRTAIERPVAHPDEDQFVVMERIMPATTADSPSTKILIFEPLSSLPVAIRTLPFHLRTALAVPSSGFFPTDPAGFTLVGVTDAWSVVVFGDDVQVPEEEGASAQGITRDAAAGKRTLFHDIFGASAFADLATGPSASTSASGSTAQPWKGKAAASAFDAPAHLVPPLEMLFDAVMDGFLAARPDDADADEEREREHDEEMDVDEEAITPLPCLKSGLSLDRVVDRQEMNGFVELFIQCAIKAPSESRLPPTFTPVNGIHKPNGVPPHINGIRGTPSTPAKNASKPNGITPNGHAYTPSQPSPAQSDASPAVKAGKKRKKSLS